LHPHSPEQADAQELDSENQIVDSQATAVRNVVMDDLTSLLSVLSERVQTWLVALGDPEDLIEIILDLGRPPQARFREREEVMPSHEVTEEEISEIVSRLSPFGDDNRAGIERTLHRISCMRNRSGKIVGLTCRVGRAVFGTTRIIEDLVLSGKSILMLGRPGVGKTTMLREVARVLADQAHKRVVVVDTSNEIAGDGDIPHPAIGNARRMQVKTPTLQHAVMIEAVENHMPQIIVIDEVGTEQDAAAARTIAERGVQLVATAHGNALENLLLNPTLSDLVGGVQTVTLGDEEARRRGSQKSVLERKAPPSFDALVEIQSWDKVAVHSEVASTVDTLLRGFPVRPELRWLDSDGKVHVGIGEPSTLATVAPPQEGGGWRNDGGGFGNRRGGSRGRGSSHGPQTRPMQSGVARDPSATINAPIRDTVPLREASPVITQKPTKVFSFGVSRDRFLDTAQTLGIGAEIASSVQEADMVLTTKTHFRNRGESLHYAQEKGLPIYVLRKNTQVQMEQFLKSLSAGWGADGRQRLGDAMEETEDAVMQVMDGGLSVELLPQSSYIRRLQHQLAERYNLGSASMGREPQRRVVIFQG
jgi:stage III sporulation protein SpoIIIAA